MNKIIVVRNNIIPFDSNDIYVDGNNINFINNGNYSIEYIDCDNVNMGFTVKDSICVNLFEYSNNKNINISNNYILEGCSSLILSKFYANIGTNEIINIFLKGEKANIKYNFSSVSELDDKYIINIYHEKDNTCSNIFNRTVAKKNSSNIFDINSYVENGVKNCYLNQQTKIVTLGDSNNKINPNMYTHENSTTAVHSSVVGSINADDLFYMMSRGISYRDSVNLIIKGIIISNINVNMEVKEKILKILDNIGGE